MSEPSRLANGVNPPTDNNQSHHTLVTHTNTQPSLQQTDTSSRTTDAKATMDQAIPSSSPLPTLPDSPRLSVKSVELIPSIQQASPTSEQPDLEAYGDDMPETTAMTETDAPAALASSPFRERTTGRGSKRMRADGEDDDSSPAPKKAARTPNVDTDSSNAKARNTIEENTKPSTNGNDHDVAGEGDSPPKQNPQELAIPEESTIKCKAKAKAKPRSAPKRQTAAAGRRRACDTCKRRKVKCKHNAADDQADANSDVKKEKSPQRPANKATMATNPMQADGEDPLTLVNGSNNDDPGTEEVLPKKTKAIRKLAPKKAAAPPERTSTRNRKAPERLVDTQEQPSTKASPVKKNASKVFDPVYITTNSGSRLGKANMHKALLDVTAWTSLSTEQQVKLVSMLPDTTEHQQLLVRIKKGETGAGTRPQLFTVNNNCFRTDVAKFQEDLKNGHLAKTWQAAAEQAVVERAAGEYDEWKAEEAELWWGQKSK